MKILRDLDHYRRELKIQTQQNCDFFTFAQNFFGYFSRGQHIIDWSSSL